VVTNLSTVLDETDVEKKSGPFAQCSCGGLIHGTYRGQEVTILGISQDTDITRLHHDVELWDNMRSNYLLSLTGAVYTPGHLMLVAEANELGTLRTLRPTMEFTLPMILKCVLDCSLALWAIHGSAYAYMRLRPENVMMFSTRVETTEMCKLILYTASPERRDTLSQLEAGSNEIDRPSYSSPELLSGDSVPNTSTDLFSLAMLTIYLFIGHDPMPVGKFPTAVDVAKFTLSGKRVDIPSQCPPDVAELLGRCLSADPTQRPKIEEFSSVIRAALDRSISKKILLLSLKRNLIKNTTQHGIA